MDHQSRPLAVSVAEAMRMTSLKRTSIFAMLKNGRLVRISVPGLRKALIETDSIHKLMGGSDA